MADFTVKQLQRGKDVRTANTVDDEVRLRYDGFTDIKEKAPARPAASSADKPADK